MLHKYMPGLVFALLLSACSGSQPRQSHDVSASDTSRPEYLAAVMNGSLGKSAHVCHIISSENAWHGLGLSQELESRGLAADSILQAADFEHNVVLTVSWDGNIGHSIELQSVSSSPKGTELLLHAKQPSAGTPQFGMSPVLVMFYAVRRGLLKEPLRFLVNGTETAFFVQKH
jgi:hypothetical protein